MLEYTEQEQELPVTSLSCGRTLGGAPRAEENRFAQAAQRPIEGVGLPIELLETVRNSVSATVSFQDTTNPTERGTFRKTSAAT